MRDARAKALIFAVASALCASPAWSAGGAAKGNRAPAYLPRCNDPAVVARIGTEYRGRHWAGVYGPIFVLRARDTNPKYWPQPDMPRRFCEAMITPPSDLGRPSYYPKHYPIYYAIIADYQLEWCVVGLDRPWAYDQRCRLARP